MLSGSLRKPALSSSSSSNSLIAPLTGVRALDDDWDELGRSKLRSSCFVAVDAD